MGDTRQQTVTAPAPGRDAPGIGITFALVICAYLAAGTYASVLCRGLYQDGAYYLYRLAEGGWFYLHDPNRMIVHVLRQAPVVAMLKFGDFPLFRMGQIFSAAMLLLPPLIVGLCWFVVPAGRKVWTLVPLIFLMTGFSAMSFQPVGEAAIAVSCFWLLLLLLLFRTRSQPSQLLFLVMCIPAFKLHEGASLLMPVFLLAIALRLRAADAPGERMFLVAAALILLAVLAYQIAWMIHPRIPAEREGVLRALLTFGFLWFQGHLNLPVMTALAGAAALAATFVFHSRVPSALQKRTRLVAGAFTVFAGTMTVVAFTVDWTLSPAAQSLSRYLPVLASLVLGLFVTFSVAAERKLAWSKGPTLAILIGLCLAQTGADIAATMRWRDYIRDLQDRVADAHGLLDWQGGRAAGEHRRGKEWELMTVGWVHPIMSIIFAPGGQVRAVLDYPPGTAFRPVDVSRPPELPAMRGVSYRPYQDWFRQQPGPGGR